MPTVGLGSKDGLKFIFGRGLSSRSRAPAAASDFDSIRTADERAPLACSDAGLTPPGDGRKGPVPCGPSESVLRLPNITPHYLYFPRTESRNFLTPFGLALTSAR